MTGAVTVPIYQTSTYAQSAPGVYKGYDYSRTDNPTRTALQTALASLRGGEVRPGLFLGHGRGNNGDAAVQRGRPHRFITRCLRRHAPAVQARAGRFKNEFSFVETSSLTEIERAITQRTRLVWLESPTNPLLRISDIAGAAKIRRTGAAPCVWLTTPLHHLTFSGRSSLARIWFSIRRPNISAAMPISWVARFV